MLHAVAHLGGIGRCPPPKKSRKAPNRVVADPVGTDKPIHKADYTLILFLVRNLV